MSPRGHVIVILTVTIALAVAPGGSTPGAASGRSARGGTAGERVALAVPAGVHRVHVRVAGRIPVRAGRVRIDRDPRSAAAAVDTLWVQAGGSVTVAALDRAELWFSAEMSEAYDLVLATHRIGREELDVHVDVVDCPRLRGDVVDALSGGPVQRFSVDGQSVLDVDGAFDVRRGTATRVEVAAPGYVPQDVRCERGNAKRVLVWLEPDPTRSRAVLRLDPRFVGEGELVRVLCDSPSGRRRELGLRVQDGACLVPSVEPGATRWTIAADETIVAQAVVDQPAGEQVVVRIEMGPGARLRVRPAVADLLDTTDWSLTIRDRAGVTPPHAAVLLGACCGSVATWTFVDDRSAASWRGSTTDLAARPYEFRHLPRTPLRVRLASEATHRAAEVDIDLTSGARIEVELPTASPER